MARLHTLERALAVLFAAPKPKRLPDSQRKDREAFKRKVAALGTTFIISRDHYVEIAPFEGHPKGVTICHHGWDETWPSFEAALADPSLLDADGYYQGS